MGLNTDQQYHAVVPPLTMTSNFEFKEFGVPHDYEYSRTHNPIRDLLCEAISVLESAAGAVVTSTGMSAVHLPFVAFLKSDDLVYVPKGSYGCTVRLLNTLSDKGHFRVRWIDCREEDAMERAFADEVPAMVFVEAASNPLLHVFDVPALAKLCNANEALLVVDNTFMPALLFPLELGADMVVHSTTKYINGHGDITGGAVAAKSEEHLKSLRYWANNIGSTGAPFDSYQILRGMRTLFNRMETHQSNTRRIIECLLSHDAVERVYHPSLPDHPGHHIAKAHASGYGAMVSFTLKGGEKAARAFYDGLAWFTMAESLGGFESLIAHPVTMTHAMVSPSERREAGIVDSMLRLSVGLEDPEDLCADVNAGLDRASD